MAQLSVDVSTLPRLLYLSHVPAEASYSGSAQIYRLLEDYPRDRLLILEAKPTCSLPARRLPGATYRELPVKENRFCRTRFYRWANSWQMLSAGSRAALVRGALGGFAPEAVLSVTEGYWWLAASRFAESEGLPLHLILHDDWPLWLPVAGCLRAKQERIFGAQYRRAASRLCVSPFMEEEYRKYGAAGQVLYPAWARNASPPSGASRAYQDHGGPLVGAYAGRIWPGYPALLRRLAERLEARGGKLLLFGPHSPGELKSWELEGKNILSQGFVSSQELISRMRAEADFLFVPMSFESDSFEHNMRISFPSKLTDYTTAGLPLFIWGPEYCAAVRWAERYAPVAEVVKTQAAGDVDAALRRLEQPRRREQLGESAREIGQRLFSHRAAMEVFQGALVQAGAADRSPLATR